MASTSDASASGVRFLRRDLAADGDGDPWGSDEVTEERDNPLVASERRAAALADLRRCRAERDRLDEVTTVCKRPLSAACPVANPRQRAGPDHAAVRQADSSAIPRGRRRARSAAAFALLAAGLLAVIEAALAMRAGPAKVGIAPSGDAGPGPIRPPFDEWLSAHTGR